MTENRQFGRKALLDLLCIDRHLFGRSLLPVALDTRSHNPRLCGEWFSVTSVRQYSALHRKIAGLLEGICFCGHRDSPAAVSIRGEIV
jgi:hypothetical protein